MMRGEMPRRIRADGEEEESIHVSPVSSDVRSTVTALAQERSTPNRRVLPRDIYAEAIAALLDDLDAGEDVQWLAPRLGGEKLMAWLPVELAARFHHTAEAYRVSHTVLFLAAMRQYFGRAGLTVEV
jgi:hypothetical protein